MNPDPSLCRLIANPHRLKKNEIKVNIVRDKGKDKIKEYLRDEYKHLYITQNIISDLDNLIKDYLTDYEISLICEEMIQRIIANTKETCPMDPKIAPFVPVTESGDSKDGVNRSIFDLLEVGDIEESVEESDEESVEESDEESDEEITSLLEDYVSDPYHFIRVS